MAIDTREENAQKQERHLVSHDGQDGRDNVRLVSGTGGKFPHYRHVIHYGTDREALATARHPLRLRGRSSS